MSHTVERLTLGSADEATLKWIVGSFDPGSYFLPHTHHTLEISMILSGRGEYWVDGRVYPMATGDVVLFNNKELHCLRNTGDTPLQNAALEFEPRFLWTGYSAASQQDFLAPFFHRNPHVDNRVPPDGRAFSSVQQQFLQIQEEFMHPQPNSESVAKARLLGLLADLLRYTDMVCENAVRREHHESDMSIVLSYMNAHYNETLSLEELAALLHVTPSYFCRLFRQSNGISPKEYLVKLRIAAAAHRLQSTDDGVLEIAQACGFNSLSNFYSAFKRVKGKSPAQFRHDAAAKP